MNQTEKILDKKLVNNDIHLIKKILSFLVQCKHCDCYDNCFAERYVVNCPCFKNYGVCNHNFLCGGEVWECKRLCDGCIKREEGIKGADKVLNVLEYEDMLLRRQEEIMMIGIRRSNIGNWGRISFRR